MTEATTRDSARNPWLDVCRSLAILLVVLGHGIEYLKPLFPNTVQLLKFTGFIGVELFFVLSGFLIGQMLMRYAEEDLPKWLQTFYMRRMIRTLPNYGLFLVVNITLAYMMIRPSGLSELWKYGLFVQNAMTPHPEFFPEAWSLAIEELFYLGFPLCFLTVAWALRISNRAAIVGTALFVIGISLFARGILASEVMSWDEGIRKIAALRFDGLMVGVLLGWLDQARWRVLRDKTVPLVLVTGLLFCAAYVSLMPLSALDSSYFAKTLLFTLTSFGCAGLVIVGIDLRLPSGLESVAALIARVSYSAYLVNLPILLIMNHVVRNEGAVGVGMFLFFHLATFLAAFVVYRQYERVFYRLRDRYFPCRVQKNEPCLQLAA